MLNYFARFCLIFAKISSRIAIPGKSPAKQTVSTADDRQPPSHCRRLPLPRTTPRMDESTLGVHSLRCVPFILNAKAQRTQRGAKYYRGQFIVNHCRWFLPEISEETQSLFRARVSISEYVGISRPHDEREVYSLPLFLSLRFFAALCTFALEIHSGECTRSIEPETGKRR